MPASLALLVLGAFLAAWRIGAGRVAQDAAGELSFEVPDPPTSLMQPQVGRALREQRERVLRQSRSSSAWGDLGRLYDAHELHAEAEYCYRRAVLLDPAESRWAYMYAVMRDTRGADADEVVPLYEELAARTRYPPALFRLGDALVRRGRLEEACAAFRRTLALDPQFVLAHRSLGQALLVQGKLTEARTHLERAAALNPEDGNTQSTLAQLYTRLGEDERAARAARSAGTLQHFNAFPDPVRFELRELALGSRALGERSAQAMSQQRFEDALAVLELLLEARPDDASVHQRMGECHERLGRREQAIEAYRRALAIDPLHPVAPRLRELELGGG